MACKILAPKAGIKHRHPAVEARSPSHWMAKEVSVYFIHASLYLEIPTALCLPFKSPLRSSEAVRISLV